MFARNIVLFAVCLICCSGCSTTGCCNWWGRNTDGSNNIGRKPTPIQQGPIAGTYTQPGNTVSPQMQPPATTAPPLNTPPQQVLPSESSSPLMTPPTPPQGVVPGQYQTQSNGGVIPPSQLPPAGLSPLPENVPSIKSPAMPGNQVPMPQVQAPALDLTIPGASGPASPAPMLLAPANTSNGTGGTIGVAPPTIEMPVIADPSVNKPVEVVPPKVAGGPKAPSLNPGTTPPPLPPNPTVPVLEKK